MKRSLVLALAGLSIILVSLVISDSPARAQQARKPVTFDTGVVPLGPNQILRLTVTGGDFDGDGPATVGFRGIKYAQGVCGGGGACQLINTGTTTIGPFLVAGDEAASLELVATTYGRGIVSSNRKDVRVTSSIINTLTGETTSHIIIANTEGDIH